MKGFFRKPKRFGFFYGLFLAAATAYVLLDTFVIPSGQVVVTNTAQAATSSASSTGSTSSGSTSSGTTSGSSTSGSTSSDSSSGTTSTTTSGTASGTYTDTTYKDDNISITITTTREYDTNIYIVDIQVSDVAYLKTAFAKSTFGRNIKETTSTMAENNNAILAINGDYYGFRNAGYVLRNGVLYRSTSNSNDDLVLESDGTMKIVNEDEVTADELESEGDLQVWSFGPALVNNGSITVSENAEVSQSKTSNPRTAIGMISPLHYVIVVSDGRTSDNAGLTLYELAEVFKAQGATVAYNLDGGGSTTLWFNGQVINNPTDGNSSGERKVSDIVYIGY